MKVTIQRFQKRLEIRGGSFDAKGKTMGMRVLASTALNGKTNMQMDGGETELQPSLTRIGTLR
jgi:hypothetical protein